MSASIVYILAGLYNLSILIFNKMFTNKWLSFYDNDIFSNHGMISIILWGFAYMSIYKNYASLPLLNMVFAIEKFYYAYRWISWHSKHNVVDIYQNDLLTGLFFTVYGFGDLLFGLFFLWQAFIGLSLNKT